MANVDEDTFALRLSAPDHLKEPLTDLVAELVDWRLARYLDARSAPQGAVLKVSHAGGRPILFLDRQRNPELPLGSVDVLTPEGVAYELDFVKVAVNVARSGDDRRNRLPDLLRSWFGEDAGHPGTTHQVHASQDQRGRWHLRPLGGDEAMPEAAGAQD